MPYSEVLKSVHIGNHYRGHQGDTRSSNYSSDRVWGVGLNGVLRYGGSVIRLQGYVTTARRRRMLSS